MLVVQRDGRDWEDTDASTVNTSGREPRPSQEQLDRVITVPLTILSDWRLLCRAVERSRVSAIHRYTSAQRFAYGDIQAVKNDSQRDTSPTWDRASIGLRTHQAAITSEVCHVDRNKIANNSGILNCDHSTVL